jgi:hypothetical protein
MHPDDSSLTYFDKSGLFLFLDEITISLKSGNNFIPETFWTTIEQIEIAHQFESINTYRSWIVPTPNSLTGRISTSFNRFSTDTNSQCCCRKLVDGADLWDAII